MHGLEKEYPKLKKGESVSLNIAKHMANVGKGCIVVVAIHPRSMIASVRKQCERVIRNEENLKASTIDPKKIAEHDEIITRLQQREFIAGDPLEAAELIKDVVFSTPVQVLAMPPLATVMYITTPIEIEALHKMTSWMPKTGRVIFYNKITGI